MTDAERFDDEAGGLAASLRRSMRGAVLGGDAARAAYSADASNYREPPRLVAVPADEDDVLIALAAATARGLPVTVRGAGTSVAGNAIGPGLVLDLRRLDRISDPDPVGASVRVQPGVVLDDLDLAVRPAGLRFGPDPSTHSRATLGGMIGNNACGAHSVAWGTTADQVVSLDVLLVDGTRLTVGSHDAVAWRAAVDGTGRAGRLYRDLDHLVAASLGALRTDMPALPRRVSGYAVDRLLPERGHHVAQALVGSEGTCAVVLGARVRLVRPPAATVLLVVAFPNAVAAAASVPALLRHHPLTVESLDRRLLLLGSPTSIGSLPEGDSWLLIEVGASTDAAAAALASAITRQERDLLPAHAVVVDPKAQRALWRAREDGAGLASRIPAGPGSLGSGMHADLEAWPGFEDAAVPPHRLAGYLADLQALLAAHRLDGLIYGHFGEGCLHQRITFDLRSPGGVQQFKAFVEEAADLVVRHGGSVSGEHGDGRSRSTLLNRMYSPEILDCFGAFKSAWDPHDLLNPGVIVRAAPIEAGLRIRPLPLAATTRLGYSYPDDRGDLGMAVQRCVGVGRCVSDVGGDVMCPSWRATHDERHSTRGRARILAEMLDGRLIRDGWRSDEVAAALDLCLGCKGCLSDCPVDVDMATYKSEFLYQRYRHRPRPRAHYALGWLPVWLRLAAAIPSAPRVLAGLAGHSLVRRLAGLDPDRSLPMPAALGYHAGRQQPKRPGPRVPGESLPGVLGPVVLWADTFGAYLEPDVLHSGERLLRGLGYDVSVSPAGLCCGLTWLATGQLGHARRVARHAARAMAAGADKDPGGVPIVVLEPSCAAALRHDLPRLLPEVADVTALASRVQTLAEFLGPHAAELEPISATGRLQVAPHCHQHAVLGTKADAALLDAMGGGGLLDLGCCGLAGGFGLERGHGEISGRIASQRWAPALDAIEPDDVLVADGFSCRTQVRGMSSVRPVHLAQALRLRRG